MQTSVLLQERVVRLGVGPMLCLVVSLLVCSSIVCITAVDLIAIAHGAYEGVAMLEITKTGQIVKLGFLYVCRVTLTASY
jgi:hypothetical protein